VVDDISDRRHRKALNVGKGAGDGVLAREIRKVLAEKIPGDATCTCGHYANWHGGMGLGVPTFCKECRCSRFERAR